MMDYHGFWLGFVLLFGGLPFVLGAVCGLVWGWRAGRRGPGLVLPTVLGGVCFGLLAFAAAALIFRA